MKQPQIHGVTKQWRTTRPYCDVFVESVGEFRAGVRDLSTGSTFEVPALTPSGTKPAIGDVWTASNETGQWALLRMVEPVGHTRATVDALVSQMHQSGAAVWEPEETLDAAVETAQGAYIGERRVFEVKPNDRWVKLNGQAISRHRYRSYFELVGTTFGVGDGSTTFNVANVAHPSDTAGWHVCVR